MRCGYCQGDNLVDPAALAKLGGRRAIDIAAYDAEVRRHGSALKTESLIATLGMVLLIAGSPLSCCVTATIVQKWVPNIEVRVPEGLDYVLVDTPTAVCVARVHARYDDGSAYLISGHGVPDLHSVSHVPGAGRMAPLRAEWFVGREVVARPQRNQAYEGRVVRVHGNALEPRAVLMVLEPASPTDPDLESACLRERPSGVAIAPWPHAPRATGRLLPDDTPYDDPRMAP